MKIIELIKYVILISLIGCVGEVSGGNYYYIRNDYIIERGREITVYIDAEFSRGEVEEIGRSLREWEYGMNGRVKFKEKEFRMGGNEIIEAEGLDSWYILKTDSWKVGRPIDRGNWKVLGYCDLVGGRKLYLLMDRVKRSQMRGVMLHEIGHLMGAVHMGDRLMGPTYDWEKYSCIDRETMLQVGERWGIKVEDLNYCMYQGWIKKK